jgi:hypothetical protein
LIKDKVEKGENLLFIQRLGDDFEVKDTQWGFLWISKDGQVKKEIFDNKQRKQQPYRTTFINDSGAAPTMLGYKSNINTYYPVIIPSVMYLITLTIGLVLTLFGLYRIVTSTKK